MSDKKEEKHHPAYGLIGWSRVQGHLPLYRSVVDTGHQIAVRISEGYMFAEGVGGDEHHMDGKRIVEVRMSESQFAAFICTPNQGVGIPCTITDRVVGGEYKRMPTVPAETKASKRLKEEGQRAAERQKKYAVEAVAQIRALVGNKLGKKGTEELGRLLDRIGDTTTANIEYAAKCLGEHAEKLTQNIQQEVEATIQARLHQLGIEAAIGLGLATKSAIQAIENKEEG